MLSTSGKWISHLLRQVGGFTRETRERASKGTFSAKVHLARRTNEPLKEFVFAFNIARDSTRSWPPTIGSTWLHFQKSLCKASFAHSIQRGLNYKVSRFDTCIGLWLTFLQDFFHNLYDNTSRCLLVGRRAEGGHRGLNGFTCRGRRSVGRQGRQAGNATSSAETMPANSYTTIPPTFPRWTSSPRRQ